MSSQQSSAVLSDLLSDDFDEEESKPSTPTSGHQSRSHSRSRKRRARTSWVWDHVPDTEEGRARIWTNDSGRSVWKCKFCPQTYMESGGTKNIARHLKGHNIYEEQTHSLAVEATIRHAFKRGEEASHSRRRLNSNDGTGDQLDPGTLEQLFVKWITSCNISFRMVERDEFRALLQYLNPNINTWLPATHNTIHGWIMRTFQQEKEYTKLALQSALSSIHFTLDLWSSPNSHALLGIVSHFTDEHGKLRSLVLGLPELQGEHSGENMASVFIDLLEDYQVASKVGYMMTDNADNNDTMMEHLSAGILYFLYCFPS